jgi:hypothetical protein
MKRASLSLLLPVALLSTLGCGSEKPDTGSARDTEDSGPTAEGPCADGGWGAIVDPAGAIHVRVDGDDAGDGSLTSPLASPGVALELARQRGGAPIVALGPGSFDAQLVISSDPGDGYSHDDVSLQGCSAAETLLEAASESDPVIAIFGASGVVIEGISTRGGTRGIQVWGGAQAALSDLVIEQAELAGLIASGSSTRLSVDEVEVRDTQSWLEVGDGVGMAFQAGVSVNVSGGGVYDSVGVGVLVSGASEVELSGLVVQGSQPASIGGPGRGIQIQDYSEQVRIEGVDVRDCHDAGVFALRTLTLELLDSQVQGTLAGDADGVATGDGVVVTRGDGNLDPASFEASLEGNSVIGSARAGVVFDGVTASASSNSLSGNGFTQEGSSMVSQGPATVSGADTVATLDEESTLALSLEPLDGIELGEDP